MVLFINRLKDYIFSEMLKKLKKILIAYAEDVQILENADSRWFQMVSTCMYYGER